MKTAAIAKYFIDADLWGDDRRFNEDKGEACVRGGSGHWCAGHIRAANHFVKFTMRGFIMRGFTSGGAVSGKVLSRINLVCHFFHEHHRLALSLIATIFCRVFRREAAYLAAIPISLLYAALFFLTLLIQTPFLALYFSGAERDERIKLTRERNQRNK